MTGRRLPTQRTAISTIEKARTVTKCATAKIDGTAFTMSGTVNYDKKGGLLKQDYVSWHGKVSHNRAECDTDYVMYYGTTKHATMHLPFVKGQKAFFEDKNVSAKKYTYAKLDMDTSAGRYILRANE